MPGFPCIVNWPGTSPCGVGISGLTCCNATYCGACKGHYVYRNSDLQLVTTPTSPAAARQPPPPPPAVGSGLDTSTSSSAGPSESTGLSTLSLALTGRRRLLQAPRTAPPPPVPTGSILIVQVSTVKFDPTIIGLNASSGLASRLNVLGLANFSNTVNALKSYFTSLNLPALAPSGLTINSAVNATFSVTYQSGPTLAANKTANALLNATLSSNNASAGSAIYIATALASNGMSATVSSSFAQGSTTINANGSFIQFHPPPSFTAISGITAPPISPPPRPPAPPPFPPLLPAIAGYPMFPAAPPANIVNNPPPPSPDDAPTGLGFVAAGNAMQRIPTPVFLVRGIVKKCSLDDTKAFCTASFWTNQLPSPGCVQNTTTNCPIITVNSSVSLASVLLYGLSTSNLEQFSSFNGISISINVAADMNLRDLFQRAYFPDPAIAVMPIVNFTNACTNCEVVINGLVANCTKTRVPMSTINTNMFLAAGAQSSTPYCIIDAGRGTPYTGSPVFQMVGGSLRLQNLAVLNSAIMGQTTSALIGGAAVSINGGSALTDNLVVSNCLFALNIISGTDNSGATFASGGAVYANGPLNTAHVENSIFFGNRAQDGFGGAIFVSASVSVLTVVNSSFISNAAGSGGAVYVDKTGIGSGVNIQASSFSSNVALNGNGGALFSASSNIVIKGLSSNKGTVLLSNFVNNNATTGYGGALSSTLSLLTLDMQYTNLSNNSALYGGAIAVTPSSGNDSPTSTGSPPTQTIRLLNVTASFNNAIGHDNGNGGAMFVNAVDSQGVHVLRGVVVNITSSNFICNSASAGGAVYVSPAGQFTARSTTFLNNSAVGSSARGGAVAIEQACDPSVSFLVPTPLSCPCILELPSSAIGGSMVAPTVSWSAGVSCGHGQL